MYRLDQLFEHIDASSSRKARLRTYVIVTDSGCFEWARSKNKDGYGQMKLNGKVRGPHRVAYESENGPLPTGLELDHLCRNRACCNPDHLEPVAHQVNMQRGLRGDLFPAVPLCKHGHIKDYVPPGRRLPDCRTCRIEAARRYQSRKRGTPVR